MNADLVATPLAAAQRRPIPACRTRAVAGFPPSAADPVRQQGWLAAIAAERDTGAFIALFNYFAPRLKAYMKKLGTSEELAEELAQDVMFIVWRKAETYDPAKSAASSWIFTIARNLRIDALRREQRRMIDTADPSLEPTPAPMPDVQLQAAQQARRVRAALDTLPREQATVVSLAFYEGKSHGEIACHLAIPLGTVKSRMRLAFQHIREALDAAGDLRAAAPRLPRAA
jgi:RNA polymerase sigma-70 factor, ECF subfamily